jgi:hypothetical protein
MIILIASLVARKHELIAATLVLLGASYTTILVIDSPALDARAAGVGACLLAIGELAHLAVDARSTVTVEADATARRIGTVTLMVLGGLFAGGALTAFVDLLHAGGLAVDVLGVAAAVGAVGLLALAARNVRAPRNGLRTEPVLTDGGRSADRPGASSR